MPPFDYLPVVYVNLYKMSKSAGCIEKKPVAGEKPADTP